MTTLEQTIQYLQKEQEILNEAQTAFNNHITNIGKDLPIPERVAAIIIALQLSVNLYYTYGDDHHDLIINFTANNQDITIATVDYYAYTDILGLTAEQIKKLETILNINNSKK